MDFNFWFRENQFSRNLQTNLIHIVRKYTPQAPTPPIVNPQYNREDVDIKVPQSDQKASKG